MKVAFWNIFGERKNAEQETLIRLRYCVEKLGHSLVEFNRKGFVTTEGPDNGRYIEDVNPDFMFTCNALDFCLTTYSDIYSVFLHWVPSGFLSTFQAKLLVESFNCYDAFAGTFEIDSFIQKFGIGSVGVVDNTVGSFIAPSVPGDFAIPAKKQKVRKIFYAGLNVERHFKEMRYYDLFKTLDETDRIDIYGPKSCYGMTNLWRDFRCYRGEIPFDGKSILSKISEAGICLALNSPMHNAVNVVTNRTYEGAAAGALIISDDNAFVKKYFKDSVFYIDSRSSGVESTEKILSIVDWANKNPDEAFEMAKRSSEIFKKELSLEPMVENFLSFAIESKKCIGDKSKQKMLVDVICFCCQQSEYNAICVELDRQFYKNIHLIVICDKQIVVKSGDTLIVTGAKRKGEAFCEAIPKLRGDCLMFMDHHSKLHQRHISKTLEVLQNFGSLFAYSGCYIKGKEKYITLNNRPIIRDEFLSFSKQSYVNFIEKDSQDLFIETIFSRACAIFKKDILQLVEKSELVQISDSVHFYLACCSIIKANVLGRFTCAITSGYYGESVHEVEMSVFPSRKIWRLFERSSGIFIKEMNDVFYKYTFETTPGFWPGRCLEGEVCWFNELERKDSGNIMNDHYMQRLLNRAEKCGVKKIPYFIYKLFSLYCKTSMLFRKK